MPESLNVGVSVREYLEWQIKSLEERILASSKADQTAITKAEESINLRLASMNEFRSQMKDQQSTYLTKSQFEQFEKSIDERIDRMNSRVTELETYKAVVAGKASVPANLLSIILGVIALILGISNVINLTAK